MASNTTRRRRNRRYSEHSFTGHGTTQRGRPSHEDPYIPSSDEEPPSRSYPGRQDLVRASNEVKIQPSESLLWKEPEVSLKFGFGNKKNRRGCLVETVCPDADWEPLKTKKKDKILLMSEGTIPEATESRHPVHVLQEHVQYHVRIPFDDVLHPTHFFMEIVLPSPKDECGCETRDACLQDFYSGPKAENYKMKTLEPLRGRMYAIYDELFRKWERIRVKRVHFNQTVTAVYLDYVLTTKQNIRFDQLYELHPRYGYWPRYPLLGELKDIVSEPDSTEWTGEATDFFKHIITDKLFLAYFSNIELDKSIPVCHDDDQLTKVSVILFGDEDMAFPESPVNALMVAAGFARPIGSMVDCIQMMELGYGVKLSGQD